jgi:hypothetical protein
MGSKGLLVNLPPSALRRPPFASVSFRAETPDSGREWAFEFGWSKVIHSR